MKAAIAVLGVLVWIGTSSGQERVPHEEALKHARVLEKAAVELKDVPLKVQVDSDKAFAIKLNEVGAMVIPAKNLSEAAVLKVGKNVVPLGHLWIRNLSPVVDGKPIPNDRLRVAMVHLNNADHSLAFFVLGIRKKGDGNLELLVYARDKEPVAVLPVEKAKGTQELPIELDGQDNGNDAGVATFKILGHYQATLPVIKQEQ